MREHNETTAKGDQRMRIAVRIADLKYSLELCQLNESRALDAAELAQLGTKLRTYYFAKADMLSERGAGFINELMELQQAVAQLEVLQVALNTALQTEIERGGK